MKDFTREELQEMRERAKKQASIKGTNPDWVRTYFRLADACNELDAYIARTIVK